MSPIATGKHDKGDTYALHCTVLYYTFCTGREEIDAKQCKKNKRAHTHAHRDTQTDKNKKKKKNVPTSPIESQGHFLGHHKPHQRTN